MNSWSTPLGGSINTATRFEMPLCTRSAASSAPAPPESSDKTMMSADATGSFTTSAHPAARRTGSRSERIAKIANAAKASTTRIGPHLGHLKIILSFIRLLHRSGISPAGEHRPCPAKLASPMLTRQRPNAGRHPRRRYLGPRSSATGLIPAKGSTTKPYHQVNPKSPGSRRRIGAGLHTAYARAANSSSWALWWSSMMELACREGFELHRFG